MEIKEVAAKLSRDLDINDPGYVYFFLVELKEEYREKYPGYRMLWLPGEEERAVLPDGTTADPCEVFKEDYPDCREPIMTGCAGCG